MIPTPKLYPIDLLINAREEVCTTAGNLENDEDFPQEIIDAVELLNDAIKYLLRTL